MSTCSQAQCFAKILSVYLRFQTIVYPDEMWMAQSRLDSLLTSRMRIFVVWLFVQHLFHSPVISKELITASTSPDGVLAISHAEDTGPSGESLDFIQVSTGENKGHIIPAKLKGITNLGALTSWSKSSSEVAVLLYWGVKNSSVLVFQRGKNNQMNAVAGEPFIFDVKKPQTAMFRDLEVPNSVKKREGFSINSVIGPLQAAIGDWVGKDQIKLLLLRNVSFDCGENSENLAAVLECIAELKSGKIVISHCAEIRKMSHSDLRKFSEKENFKY